MKKTLKLALALALGASLLSGCSSVPEISDKTPCTGYVPAGGDCIAVPINTPLRRA